MHVRVYTPTFTAPPMVVGQRPQFVVLSCLVCMQFLNVHQGGEGGEGSVCMMSESS